jgi:putative DNA primase/helicase
MKRAEPPPRVVEATSAATVKPRRVRWLWEPRVPLGKLTILAGPAGQGKSQLACMLAALTSVGAAAGDLLHTTSDVLFVSAEDDPEDTIVPRLMAAGAYLERVHLLDAREIIDGTPFPSSVSLPGDAAAIHRHVERTGARLVILDPISGFLDDEHSAVSNQEVRRALSPLKEMAQVSGCAVVCIMHPNKGSSTNALARIADSGAFTALARSVMLLGPDPADLEGERGSGKVLALPKSNLAGRGEHSLALKIEGATVTGQDDELIATSRVVITGASEATASDLLQPVEDGTSLGEARAFLRAELADGPRPASDIKISARDADLADRTLRRARELDCDVEKERASAGRWMWRLKAAKPPDPCQKDTLATFPFPSEAGGPQAVQEAQGVQGGQGGGGRSGSHLPSNGHNPDAELARLTAKYPDINGDAA